MSVEFEELKKLRENPADEANNMVEFSDEEGYGKFSLSFYHFRFAFECIDTFQVSSWTCMRSTPCSST